MLHLFFKAIRHKKEHTRHLSTGKVVSVRAFDYRDPRIARLKPGRGKDTATEDLFNPEFSGDLYDPKVVRAARQATPKPVKTPKLISAQQGPDVSVPDLFSALDNAEKISYHDLEASQSGEAKSTEREEKMKEDQNNQVFRVWARKNINIDGVSYLAGARMKTASGRAKNFNGKSSAENWCREHFGDQWPEYFEIALR